jgi:hypothetical protein
VQVCTREFIDVLKAAGIHLEVVPFDGDARIATKLLRIFDSSPFVRPFAPILVTDIREAARRVQPDFVFLNQENLAVIAPLIRPHLPRECKIVVLSHGLESTDLLHTLRVRDALPIACRSRPTPEILLGRILQAEVRSRQAVDAVCSISPFDAELEQWLGTKRVKWLPRIINARPVRWQPVGCRLGFVGTLDHAPNLEGLTEVLKSLAGERDTQQRVRIVGGPTELGHWLASSFTNADYLGPLDDLALEAEASTWTAFIHPIFCLPRGCSTKLATGLAWQIPVVTTPQGRRGYVWREGKLLEAETAQQFALICHSLLDVETADCARGDVIRVVATSPQLADVAAMMREALTSWSQ